MAAEMIGRKLESNEVVHHWDGNPWNNLPNNVLVCTRAWHYRIHLKGKHDGKWIRLVNVLDLDFKK